MLRKFILILRAAGLLGSAVGAFYFIGLFRTADFGLSLRMTLAGFVIMLPFLSVAVVALIGLGLRRVVIGVAVWATMTLMTVEGLAQVQEAIFKAKYHELPPSADALHETRWWPFRGNVLIYIPERAEWMGDC